MRGNPGMSATDDSRQLDHALFTSTTKTHLFHMSERA